MQFSCKIHSILTCALSVFAGSKAKHGGIWPENQVKTGLRVQKSKVPIYVIDPREVATERTRSIFGDEEEATADVLIGIKVGKRLEGANPVVGVETIGEE